jgi:hypothetical protein
MDNSKIALQAELAQVIMTHSTRNNKLVYKIRTQLNIKNIRKHMNLANYWTSISSLMHFKDCPKKAIMRGETI